MFRRLAVLTLAVVSACAIARRDENLGDAPGADGTHHDAAVIGHDGSAGGGNPCAFTGTLASWDLTGQPGTQATTAPATMATTVTAGALTRAAAVTAVGGANSINGSNWPTTTTLDTTKYFAFTLTPTGGCTLSITSLAIDVKASGSGPATAMVATDVDAYGFKVAVSTSAASTPAIMIDSPTTRELRVYGYSATSTGGTMRIQNTLSVIGATH